MSRAFVIQVDEPGGADVAALLREHLESAVRHSPPGAVHALDLDRLRRPDITFWTVRQGGALAGVGALRELHARHGEIKSMRTATAFLRQGVASLLLEHMLGVAGERGYRRVSLETGNTEDFAPARALYQRFGFERCAPFGSYVDDGFSVCMTRSLAEQAAGT